MQSHNYSILDKNFSKKDIDFYFKKIPLNKAKKYINRYYTPEKKSKFTDFNKFINNKDGEFLISEDDEIIGFVMVDKESKEIAPLKIMEKYRGYGLGKVLVEDAIKMGGNNLGVLSDNAIAIKLYKDAGFKIDKDKTPIKHKSGNSVIFMYHESCKNEKISEVILEKYLDGKMSQDKFLILQNLLNNEV